MYPALEINLHLDRVSAVQPSIGAAFGYASRPLSGALTCSRDRADRLYGEDGVAESACDPNSA
jgi:hypothetical protein